MMSWKALKTEWLRLKNKEEIKKELSRLTHEISQFPIQDHIPSVALDKLKLIENRYKNLHSSFSQAQRNFDREFHKILRQFKIVQKDLEARIEHLQKAFSIRPVHQKKESSEVKSYPLDTFPEKERTAPPKTTSRTSKIKTSSPRKKTKKRI